MVLAPLNRETDNADRIAKYRLLWVCPGHERYGCASLILSLAKVMLDRGHDVRIAAIGSGYLVDQCSELGITCYVVDAPDFVPFGGSFATRIFNLYRISHQSKVAALKTIEALNGWSPQVVHCARPNLIEYASQLAKRFGAQTIWEMPNLINRKIPFDLAWRYYTRLCQKNDVVVLADSKFTGDTLASDNVKPIVFYHTLDDSRFDPETVDNVSRQELGLKEDDIVIGIVARVCASKGQDLVVETVIKLGDEYPNLNLLLLGGPTEDEFVDRLKSRISETGFTNRIKLLGPIQKPQRYYQLMDFSMNSRVDPEPFGLSVIESMLMGTPVLVHALGGPAETVLDGETGWHVHEASIDSFAKGISRAIGDRVRWPQIRHRCRKHALEHFGTETSVQRYLKVLASLDLE